jgi:hypothetical protein
VRVLTFVLVPAGLIAHLPVQLMRQFNPLAYLAAWAGAAAFSLLATGVSRLGLRRYESGNLLTMRG